MPPNTSASTTYIPASRYYEATSEWTLDYPPLFAWFEWAMTPFARLADPKMLSISNLGYDDPATVLFQRASVSVTGLMLAVAAYYGTRGAAGKTMKGQLLFFLLVANSGLMLVDNIHFQYNGILLGEEGVHACLFRGVNSNCARGALQSNCSTSSCCMLLSTHARTRRNTCAATFPHLHPVMTQLALPPLQPTLLSLLLAPPLVPHPNITGLMIWSLFLAQEGRYVASGILFAILLNMKHLFAYVAPIYFVFLLRQHCMGGASGFPGAQAFLARLAALGVAVVAVFAMSLGPFIAMGQLPQV